MKRKDFLNHLLRISELNECISSLKGVPFVITKPTNQKQKLQRDSTQVRILTQLTKNQEEKVISNNQEVIIIDKVNPIQSLASSKQKISLKRRLYSNRLKTSPYYSKLKNSLEKDDLEDNKNLLENELIWLQRQAKELVNRKSSANSSYLSIQQILPKRPVNKQSIMERRVEKQTRKYTKCVNRHSFTEPSQNLQTTSTSRQIAFEMVKIQSKQNHKSSIYSTTKYQPLIETELGKLSEQRITKANLRRQINKSYTKAFIPPPKLTAKSYIIYEVRQPPEKSRQIISSNSKIMQEVASLTKIMTCILTLQTCRIYNVDKFSEEICIGGTTASLQIGQIYNLQQLLHGLMLPSGNDASIALAVWAGRKMIEDQIATIPENNMEEVKRNKKMEYYNRFILEMNVKAKSLNMTKTNYANSHGLINPNNKSSAFDIAILCEYAMKNDDFRSIVQSKHYKTTIKVCDKINQCQYSNKQESDSGSSADERYNFPIKQPLKQQKTGVYNCNLKKNIQKTIVQWQNTHKLLHLRPKEYIGIKTGFTTAAGPCLSSAITINNRQFIIVVLGCARMGLRFKETELLKKWLFKHEGIKRRRPKQHKSKTQGEQIEQLDVIEQDKISQMLQKLNSQQIED